MGENELFVNVMLTYRVLKNKFWCEMISIYKQLFFLFQGEEFKRFWEGGRGRNQKAMVLEGTCLT